MHFGAFWSSFGLGMNSTCMEQGGWMKLKTKEARNVLKRRRINVKRTKSSATKGCHSTIHLSIIVVHHHCTPFGFLCRASSSTFPPLTHLLHHSTSLSFLYHVHNHSYSLAATPLHFTLMLCIITSLSPLNHFKHQSLHSIATPFLVPSIISDFMHHCTQLLHHSMFPSIAMHFLYKRKCV